MAANREELKGSISFLILAGVVSWLLDLSRDSRDMALLVDLLSSENYKLFIFIDVNQRTFIKLRAFWVLGSGQDQMLGSVEVI